MTISFPASITAYDDFQHAEFTGRSIVAMAQSPFTGQQQVQEHQGQFWLAEITLNNLPRGSAEDWIAFFLSLHGRRGTFTMGDPTGGVARGSAGVTPGTPVIKGASQSGDTLAIDGATASAAAYLSPGDYIQLGTGGSTHLHKVVVQADTLSGGNVTLEIWPFLRVAPGDNDAVIVGSTVGLWRMDNNDASWSEDPLVWRASFNAIEVI